MKGRPILRYLIILVAALLIVINPTPFIVSAWTDSFAQAPPPPKVSTPKPVDSEKLKEYLSVEAAFLGISDSVSIYYKDLNSGAEVSISPDKSWIPASTIKAFVAAEAFHQRKNGAVDFSREVTVAPDNVVANELETDEFPRLREGTVVNVGKLVEAMIIQSDNTAYNTLVDVLGRQNINSNVHALGMANTTVGEKLNLDDNQLRRDQVVAGYQFNTTTAGDYKKFFELLYNHKIPDSDELLAIFKRQKLNSMIPSYLPGDISVAHKTGEWAPVYHDGGIVYKPGAAFIISIFTNSPSPASVAKLAQVAYFNEASVVDGDTPKITLKAAPRAGSTTSKIYLAVIPKVAPVLAAEAGGENITAADLGITSSDLTTTPSQKQDIKYSVITPYSVLYPVKRWVEDWQLGHAKEEEKPAVYLAQARARLSELKTISGFYDPVKNKAINEGLTASLKNAAEQSQANIRKDEILLQTKQLSDLQYIALGSTATKVSGGDSKEKFVDDIYKNLKKNREEIGSILKNSPAVSVARTQPVIGTVEKIKEGVAQVKLESGREVSVYLSGGAKVRDFGEPGLKSITSVVEGTKIAIIGKVGADQKITPVFILKSLPVQIPKEGGDITEIKPKEGTFRIQNSDGQTQEIKVKDTTEIKSKDTTTSLEGIKAGSQVTVVGTKEKSVGGAAPTIHATQVVVTKNGSGKEEKVENKEKNKEEQKHTNQPKSK